MACITARSGNADALALGEYPPSKLDSNALRGCGLEAISKPVTNGRYRWQPARTTNSTDAIYPFPLMPKAFVGYYSGSLGRRAPSM